MRIIKNIFFTLLGMFIGVLLGFGMTRSAEKSTLERNINVVSAYNETTDANLSYNIMDIQKSLQSGTEPSLLTLRPVGFPETNFSLLGPKFSLYCKHVDKQVLARFKAYLGYEKEMHQKIYGETCDADCANGLITTMEAMRGELNKTGCAMFACIRRLNGSLDEYNYDFSRESGFEAFCAKEYAEKDAAPAAKAEAAPAAEAEATPAAEAEAAPAPADEPTAETAEPAAEEQHAAEQPAEEGKTE